MGQVLFYQLERFGLDDVVDMLVPKALEHGWRVMIRCPDRAALERLDARLWLQPEDGFLPHGLEGGGSDAAQPVLLGQGPAVNGAKAVLLYGAQAVDLEEAARLERVWLVFDQSGLELARAQWKAVAGSGLVAQYFNDASGRWEKKAESKPAG